MMNAYFDQRHSLDHVSQLQQEAATDRLVRSHGTPRPGARLRGRFAQWLRNAAARIDSGEDRQESMGRLGRLDAGMRDDRVEALPYSH